MSEINEVTAKVIELATSGLLVDGAHHKQWYLERILETLGADLARFREICATEGYELKDGIEP